MVSTVHPREVDIHPTTLGGHPRGMGRFEPMGADTATRARVRADIVRIVHRRVDLPELVRTVGRTLQRAVPFDGVCLLTVDPATLLPTGEIVENGLPPPARVRLTEIELGEPDFNKFTALARRRRPRGEPQRGDRRRARPQPASA